MPSVKQSKLGSPRKGSYCLVLFDLETRLFTSNNKTADQVEGMRRLIYTFVARVLFEKLFSRV